MATDSMAGGLSAGHETIEDKWGWDPGQVVIVGPAGDGATGGGGAAPGDMAFRARIAITTLASNADGFAMPDDLADYWIHGEGAAKVRWCTEGSFDRARRALREHVPAPMLDGTVANLYKRACGKWPGQDHD